MERNSRVDRQINAENLSMKLLKIVGKRKDDVHGCRPLAGLKDLTNRLQRINQRHQHDRVMREKTNDWIRDGGVDLSKMNEMIEEQKRMAPKEESKKHAEEWEKSEFSGFKGLDFSDMLFKCEERLAHKAIKTSFGAKQSRMAKMEKLRNLNFNKVVGNKELSTTIEPRRHEDSEGGKELQKLYCLAIEEGIEVSGPESLEYLHTRLASCMDGRQSESAWLYLLSSQIEMIRQLSYQGRAERKKNLSILSIQALQNYYCWFQEREGLQHFRDVIINWYGSAEIPRQDLHWSEAFVELRRGRIGGVQAALSGREDELFQALSSLEDQMKSLQWIDLYHSVDTNELNSCFERALKLIVMGVWPDNWPKVGGKWWLLDDAWLILRVLGISRNDRVIADGQLSRMLRGKIREWFVLTSKQYQGGEKCWSLLLGLVALGGYGELLDWWEQLKSSRTLTPAMQQHFLHLFILLTSNPSVFSALHYENSTHHSESRFIPHQQQQEPTQIMPVNHINTMLIHIISYLQQLKSTRSSSFSAYFRTLVLIIHQLRQHQYPPQALQEPIKAICVRLFPHMTDLHQFGTLISTSYENTTEKLLYSKVIGHVRPKSSAEHLELAQICKMQGRTQLQSSLLLRLVMRCQLGEQESELFQGESSRERGEGVVRQAMSELKRIALYGMERQVYNFLSEWAHLGQNIVLRQEKKFRGRLDQLGKYRYQVRILDWLETASAQDGVNYFGVYVSYYERLRRVIQVVHINNSSISLIKDTNRALTRELSQASEQYRRLQGPRLGRLLEQLKC